MTELNKNNEKASFWIFVSFCIFIAMGLIVAHLFGFSTVKKGELIGTDGYVRLTRVADLYETGDWYHPARMKTNTPYGDTLPWSRPFDVLLLLGAVPLSKLMGFQDTLFWWGVAVSPVLLTLTLIALHWVAKVLLSKDAPFFIIFIIGFQFGFAGCFKPARPDHHSFLVLFFVLLVGFALRLAMLPFRRPLCWLAGMTAAMAVWASIESMVMVGVIICVMGLFWVFQKGDFLKKSWHFSVALFIFSCVCLFLERPFSDIRTVELDRLSIVYCGLFGLSALFWLAASMMDRWTPLLKSCPGRIVYSVIGAAVMVVVMWLLFPKFYNGPLADIDSRIIPIWFEQIQEIQPLFSKTGSLTPFVQVFGAAVVSAVFVVYRLFKIKDRANRNGWILLIMLTAAFGFLACYQVRWLVYPQILLSVVMAELLCGILSRFKERASVLLRALAKSAIILVFSMGFMFLGFLADGVFKRENPVAREIFTSLIPLSEYLNEKAQIENKDLRLFTHNNFAGEILYRTDCEVIGSNYHRNGQGIVDNHAVMNAETDEVALEILRNRQIDLVLLWPQKNTPAIEEQPREVSTFSHRLREGQAPLWLNEVQLPENLSDDFLMFETDF